MLDWRLTLYLKDEPVALFNLHQYKGVTKCLDCVKEIGYRGKKISNCSTVLTVPKRELGTKKTKSRIVPNKERVYLELFG